MVLQRHEDNTWTAVAAAAACHYDVLRLFDISSETATSVSNNASATCRVEIETYRERRH